MNRIPSPRDVMIMQEQDTVFVSAVDSCGAIGMLPHDVLEVSPETASCFTARVALMEILTVGAEPAFASVSISNSPQVAEKILVGIRQVLDTSVPLIISTEKNMPTTMTAFGITIIGTCKVSDLHLKDAQVGDILYCAGLPLVGGETLEKGIKLVTPDHIRALLGNPLVHGIIPVGSKGIAAEAKVLAGESNLVANMYEDTGINLNKSAGPSSCAVFAAQAGAEHFNLSLPVTAIGKLC